MSNKSNTQDNEEIKESENIKDNIESATEEKELNLENNTNNTNEENKEKDNIENIQEELTETKDKLLRALAENENTRKQMEKVRQEGFKYGIQPLAREILSVVDNFDRALSSNSKTDEKALEEGFVLIKKEILDILEKFSIKKINALGENFDANYHQAMFEKETENYEPGVVCEIVQEGYKFHDRLLRPVLAGVAKKPLNEDQIEQKPSEEDENNLKE